MKTDFRALLSRAARLAGQHLDRARLDEIDDDSISLEPLDGFIEAWQRAGLAGMPHRLESPSPADLPFVAWHPETGWVLVLQRHADGRWQAERVDGTDAGAIRLNDACCIALPERPAAKERSAPSALTLVIQALLSRKRLLMEAVLATGLINLLTMATSLYAMQVFDRVIPNHGFQTLAVLTVSAALAVGLEFLLKQVRSHMMDRTATVIDQELSGRFFQRMLSIRMEARPAAVGTLASQVKAFEMVRGVLTSTTLLVLADVPFAILFITVIAWVGGWVAVVPLVTVPVVSLVGLMFQVRIQQHTRDMLAVGNRKAGLLVEAADGVESIKANVAEWRMQRRWNLLASQSAIADDKLRSYHALAQNITVALQQSGYLAIIAVGAWLVTENRLTMGGLLACSILANRAMLPIVQLPAVMVQWAHAKSALEGLDKILSLPSEEDEAAHALIPQTLDASVHLERVRFYYGHTRHAVVDIGRLEIRPGERVGLIGPIGSGKSTLLKIASGLYRPSEGKAYLSGMDMALLSPGVARMFIGYLPQEPRLFSGTLRENLLMGLPDPGDAVILDAARRSGLSDLINAHPKGLALEITEGGRGVSGGQKQLIALTRLLLAKPRLWLLDEPTGSMDADSEARLIALFRQTLGPEDSALIATHKMAWLPLLTRLVVIHGGRVLMDGPRDEIMARLSGQRVQSTSQQARI